MINLCITIIISIIVICYTLIKFKYIDINKLNPDDYILVLNYIDVVVTAYSKTIFLSNYEKKSFDDITKSEKEILLTSVKDVMNNYISIDMKSKIYKYFNINSLSVYIFNLLKGINDGNIK